jgi:hypothetical protein
MGAVDLLDPHAEAERAAPGQRRPGTTPCRTQDAIGGPGREPQQSSRAQELAAADLARTEPPLESPNVAMFAPVAHDRQFPRPLHSGSRLAGGTAAPGSPSNPTRCPVRHNIMIERAEFLASKESKFTPHKRLHDAVMALGDQSILPTPIVSTYTFPN